MTQPPNLPEAIRKAFTKSKDRRITAQYLTDEQLVIAAKYWRDHITIPDDNAPVYETTLVHAILPELIRRFDPTTNTYPTPTKAVNNAMGMDADEAYQYLKAWQHGDDLSEFDTPVLEN